MAHQWVRSSHCITFADLFSWSLSSRGKRQKPPLHHLYYSYGLFVSFGKINAVLNSITLPLVEINLIVKPIVLFYIPSYVSARDGGPRMARNRDRDIYQIPPGASNLILTRSALPPLLVVDGVPSSIIPWRSTRGNLPSIPRLPPVDFPPPPSILPPFRHQSPRPSALHPPALPPFHPPALPPSILPPPILPPFRPSAINPPASLLRRVPASLPGLITHPPPSITCNM